MRRIAIINQKGGVGKTTSCCNLGAAIAGAGKSTLLIDLDPQAHLTMHLGVEPDADRSSVYDLLTDNAPIGDVLVEVSQNLHLLPSHIDLAAAEMELVSVMGREVILRDALLQLDSDYDFVMIDCPPSLGVLTLNGLAAVREVIIPLQPHFLALQGVGKLLETIKLVRSRINPDLVMSGVILCMYDAGTRLASEVAADLGEFLEASRDAGEPWSQASIFNTIIRRNIKLAECPSHGLSIFDYAARSNGAIDYADLAAEVLGVSRIDAPETAVVAGKKEGKGDAGSLEADRDDSGDLVKPEQPPATYPRPPQPAYIAGDRVAFGPDDMAATNEESAAAVSDEADEQEDARDSREGEVSCSSPEEPKKVPVVFEDSESSAISPRRSIPITYEPESESFRPISEK